MHVRAENRYALLTAVRNADPSGRYAMAAVESHPAGRDPVLLVDAPRLAAVAHWLPQYGLPTAAAAAAALHPAGRLPPIMVTGGQLAVDVALDPVADPTRQIFVLATLADAQGGRVIAQFGPLMPGERKRFLAADRRLHAGARLPARRLRGHRDRSAGSMVAAGDGVKVTLHQVDQSGPDQTRAAAVRAWPTGPAGGRPPARSPANLVISSVPTPQGGMAS